MSNADSTDDTNKTSPPSTKKVYRKRFCESWLKEPIFTSWLEKCEGNVHNVWCKACNINLTAGRSELVRHGKTTAHTIRMQRLGTLNKARTELSTMYYESNSCPDRVDNSRIPRHVIDLRSDTLTKPTKRMREAMSRAEVGDDVFHEDPTVQKLEETAAGMLEMEAALFVSSGTMGNLIAIMNHCNVRGSEAYCGTEAHCMLHEQCGAAQLAGVSLRPLQNNPDGTFNIQELKSKLRKDRDHEPISKLVMVENTINGKVVPQSWITELVDFCKDQNLKLHMDGARLWNASVESEKSAAEIVAGFDSVTFCLSKGLGAPVGSVLCGSKEFIEKARRVRKVLGGGMRQVGVLAAAGLVALTDTIPILKEDHRRAYEFAKSIKDTTLSIVFQGKPLFRVNLDTVQTNMVFVEVDTRITTAMNFASRLREICNDDKNDVTIVKCLALNDSTVRFVFYHEITDKQVSWAIKKVKHVMVNMSIVDECSLFL